jgi:hypothetical protein
MWVCCQIHINSPKFPHTTAIPRTAPELRVGSLACLLALLLRSCDGAPHPLWMPQSLGCAVTRDLWPRLAWMQE